MIDLLLSTFVSKSLKLAIMNMTIAAQIIRRDLVRAFHDASKVQGAATKLYFYQQIEKASIVALEALAYTNSIPPTR